MNITPQQISAVIIGIVTIATAFAGHFWIPLIGMISICTILKGC